MKLKISMALFIFLTSSIEYKNQNWSENPIRNKFPIDIKQPPNWHDWFMEQWKIYVEKRLLLLGLGKVSQAITHYISFESHWVLLNCSPIFLPFYLQNKFACRRHWPRCMRTFRWFGGSCICDFSDTAAFGEFEAGTAKSHDACIGFVQLDNDQIGAYEIFGRCRGRWSC